jgi:hypothetical protein
VPFLLTPETRPAIGLLRPSVVAALRADNAWRSANGHPLAWDIPASASGSSTDTPPYIALAPALAQGSPAARTFALVETLNRWRADANAGEGVGRAFADVIVDKRWRGEWYDVHVASSSVLRADRRDPLTLLDIAPATATTPESGLSSRRSGYAFSMERVACKLFGVVTYGVHMTVYEQRKGDVGVDANGVRVWVPRRAATKPTCVHLIYISPFLLPFFFFLLGLSRMVWGMSPPRHSHSFFMITISLDLPRACVKLSRHAR